ncbi:MAG: hypothetical protein ACFB4J_18075 [Elainellaceae cyanobacterium]
MTYYFPSRAYLGADACCDSRLSASALCETRPNDRTLGEFIGGVSGDRLLTESLPSSPSAPENPPFFRLRLLALGVPYAVDNCRLSLHRLGYADPNDWSIPLPITRTTEVIHAADPGEILRILTKRIPLPRQN